MKAREVFLLILIIVAGILFTHFQLGKIHWRLNDWGIFTSEEFFFEETRDINPPLPVLLEVQNRHGEVNIQGTENETVKVTLQKIIWRRNKDEAAEVAQELNMEIKKESDRIIVSTNRYDFERRNFETDFLIQVPKSMKITVHNSYGKVVVSDTGSSFIDNRRGKIFVSNITGSLTVNNSFDDVRVENISETCSIKNRYGQVDVKDVGGTVDVDLRTGDILLENMNQGVTVSGSNNSVRGEKLNCPLDIESSFRRIALYDVGPVKIQGRQSPIEVKGSKGAVEIRNRFAKIEVEGIEGNLFIEGKSLSVLGSRIIAENITIDSSNEDIELREFSGKTDIKIAHGQAIISPSPLTHAIDVEASYSDIRFMWPPGEKYPFQGSVKNGEIKWMLANPPGSTKENGLTVIKAFSELSNRPPINLSTSYGTIWIEE
ncbi:MAG: hypothetical protein JXB26_01215 [Candidatus Aminicenantes bacterium]|nr:hypothetical protein [Candidatus Aminicenantes bacterium]